MIISLSVRSCWYIRHRLELRWMIRDLEPGCFRSYDFPGDISAQTGSLVHCRCQLKLPHGATLMDVQALRQCPVQETALPSRGGIFRTRHGRARGRDSSFLIANCQATRKGCRGRNAARPLKDERRRGEKDLRTGKVISRPVWKNRARTSVRRQNENPRNPGRTRP